MYSQKAFEILRSSINSAVFIDEKAKDLFSETPVDSEIPEENLSRLLYNNFKNNGKNLTVHKFKASDVDNSQILDFLFNGKDLILLDWELAEFAGEVHSLKLLKEAVKRPYLNFCCIYSNSQNINSIPLFLDTYFSGLSKNDFESIRDHYSYFDVGDIEKVYSKTNQEIIAFCEDNNIKFEDFPIKRLNNKDVEVLFRYIYISLTLDRYQLPDVIEEYDVLNSGNESFIINNTFVFTLKKGNNDDNDYDKLLRRISEAVILNKGSFFQLLGLEMKSIFNQNEQFIDETILKSSTEALFKYRNSLNDDKEFGSIIKKLLLEQASLKLRTAKLQLLDSSFLEEQNKELLVSTSLQDLFQLNVFYNSVSVKGLDDTSVPNLNFGDVFKGSGKDYYLCITALCDCYRPKEGNFYFAKGTEFDDIEMAIKLGDTAFLSFLPNGKVVLWGNREIVKNPSKTKKLEGEDEHTFAIRKENERIKFEAEAYKKFLFKPFFIKPKVYNVPNNKLVEGKISIWDITTKIKDGKPDSNLNDLVIEYVTTLRSDYAQRIANHAFGHPARVGVDFVKI